MARASAARAPRWYEYIDREERLSTIKGGRPVKADSRPHVEVTVPDSFESPESSTIAGASYDANTLTLMVTFKRKGDIRERYDYPGVPASLWKEFTLAPSKGQFFGARIRPLYQGTKIVRK